MADHSPTTAAEFITLFNSTANNGDRILLPSSGSFDCSGTPLISTRYFDIVGPGSGDFTILCNVDFQPATAGQIISWSGFMLDGRSNAPVADGFAVSGFYFNKGIYTFNDVYFRGPNTSGTDALVNCRAHITDYVKALFVDCTFHGSNGDLLVSKGGTTAAANFASWLRCVRCTGIDRGSGSSDQAFSAHDGVRMDLFNCTYYNSDLSVDNRSCVAPGASLSPPGGQTMMRLFNCDIVGKVSVARMLGGRIRCTDGFALEPKIETGSGDFLFAGVEIQQTSGTTRGIQTADAFSGRIESCLVQTPSAGNNAVYVTGSGRIEIVNCRFTGMSNPVATAATGTGTIVARNNICEGTTRANFQHGSASTTWYWDYNRISGTGNHVTGPHDFTEAAQLNANGTPVSGGNCDRGAGDQQLPYFWHQDLLGNPREPDYTARAIGPIEPALTAVSSLHAIESGVIGV